ncbi:hypothetical protein [Kitasatospora herbaricolor]|uniref:STAS domain-containing protein n=1 Tax=Kitasatospora herbaricolor TaxID=68217 RepID=A0ABZ1WJ72_9ACTN|nr:hypothetical protein [Kitasatospora herbaricolor]
MNDATVPAFTAVVRDTPAGPVVQAAGELDLNGAPTLHAALRHALATGRPSKLVIALADVTDNCLAQAPGW